MPRDLVLALDLSEVGDGDVVGREGDLVLYFNAEDGSYYNDGLTVQDFLDGDAEAWLMTEAEATRLGVEDYDAYVARVSELNPYLAGIEERPRIG